LHSFQNLIYNDLQHPQADVGDGEGLVVADVLASRLLRVANIIGLLVAPNELRRRAQDQDAEDEQHREPHPADHRRKAPVTHDRSVALQNEGWGREGRKGCSWTGRVG
uniref:Uncharacterized protein n=1 Tax=Oryzias latipes TaxID=8090 RepID=A0A3P9HPU5_ORYLA